MSAKAIIRRPGEGKGVSLGGHPMAFLVTGDDTKHTSMFEWTIPPGFSTGLHVHRVQEETFYLLEGECDWQVGDERVRATPGMYLFLPPGVPHNIANASDRPARVLMTVSPPGTSTISRNWPRRWRAVAPRILTRSRACARGTTRISSLRSKTKAYSASPGTSSKSNISGPRHRSEGSFT